MKNLIKNLLLLLFLFGVVFFATAQENKTIISNRLTTHLPMVDKIGLPMNRTAFIFSNNNSKYSNPAVAILNTKTQSATKQNTVPVSTFVENQTNDITHENVCMFSNQTEDELWIKVNAQIKNKDEMNVEIYNDQGIRIYNSLLNENLHKINLCNLMAGSFLVKLGENIQKIIIE